MKLINFLKKPINVYLSILVLTILVFGLSSISFAYFIPISTNNKLETVGIDNRITSDDLVNQTITLNPNESKIIELYVTSYNDYVTDFKLSYRSDNKNISVRRIDNLGNDLDIYQSKKVNVEISNNSDVDAFIKFEIDSGMPGDEIKAFGIEID